MNTDEPLIYTSKGNLPIASLQYKSGWQDTEGALVFFEEYWLGEELVKRSAHALSKQGLTGQTVAGNLNG